MKLFFVIEENYEWDTDKITLERFPPLEKKKIIMINCFPADHPLFPRILKSLQPLPRQQSAVIGCTKNCTKKPIGVTVHSHCVESFEGLLQRCRRGRGCSEL